MEESNFERRNAFRSFGFEWFSLFLPTSVRPLTAQQRQEFHFRRIPLKTDLSVCRLQSIVSMTPSLLLSESKGRGSFCHQEVSFMRTDTLSGEDVFVEDLLQLVLLQLFLPIVFCLNPDMYKSDGEEGGKEPPFRHLINGSVRDLSVRDG